MRGSFLEHSSMPSFSPLLWEAWTTSRQQQGWGVQATVALGLSPSSPTPRTCQQPQARRGPSCLLRQRKLLQGVVRGTWVSPAPSLVPHMLRSRKEQEQVRRQQHSPDISLTQGGWQQAPCPGLGEASPISLRPSGHHGQHRYHHHSSKSPFTDTVIAAQWGGEAGSFTSIGRKPRLMVVRWFAHNYTAGKWQSRTRAPLAAQGPKPPELQGSITSGDLGKGLHSHHQEHRELWLCEGFKVSPYSLLLLPPRGGDEFPSL